VPGEVDPFAPEGSNMASDRPKASREDVDQAIREIRAYHAQGRKSLREQPERGSWGAGEINAQAKKLGWNPDKLRSARQFADPENGYSGERLDELFRLLREHRPVFGVSHAGRLASVPMPLREEIQRECVEGNWSVAELGKAIKKRLGRRRHGGRRRRVSREAADVLVQLEEMTDTWRRWFRRAADGEDDRPILDGLPARVREKVREVDAAMSGLRDAVTARLEALRKKADRGG
jgi:hypothetical protein